MVDSIIEKITNQRNINSEKNTTNLLNNIRGKIRYSSDELIFLTDSGDFVLKDNNSNFVKDGDLVRANIKNEGKNKYLHIIDRKTEQNCVLEIIGYNDKSSHGRSKIQESNQVQEKNQAKNQEQEQRNYSLIKSFKNAFLEKEIEIEIISEKQNSERQNNLSERISANPIERKMNLKSNTFRVAEVEVKLNNLNNKFDLDEVILQNKNNLPSSEKISTETTKYCEVIGLNANKKLVTKSNDEIIIIDSKGKELPRGVIIKLESSALNSGLDSNKRIQQRAQNISDAEYEKLSNKIYNLVEDLKFIETIFYRVGNLISQNLKLPKSKYKSILDLLKRRFSKKMISNLDPKSLDKLSKEVMSKHELKNLLEDTADDINSIKRDIYDSKNTYQISVDLVKNQKHTIQITEEEKKGQNNNDSKKLIHFFIDTENLSNVFVKKICGVVELCYNSNVIDKLELKIFYDDTEVEKDLKRDIESIFNTWIKKENKEGEILFCKDEEVLKKKKSTNNIGLKISV